MRASSILPQSGYMVFADEILEVSDGYASCAFSVKEDSPFTEDGKLGSYAYMEIMAQCIGVYSGYRNDGEGLYIFDCEIRCDGEHIASATLSVMRASDEMIKSING